jgi:hypothetical protein
MEMHEAYELKEALGADEANRLIQGDGWKLLAVTQTSKAGPMYILGKKKPNPPMPSISPNTLGVSSSRRVTRGA